MTLARRIIAKILAEGPLSTQQMLSRMNERKWSVRSCVRDMKQEKKIVVADQHSSGDRYAVTEEGMDYLSQPPRKHRFPRVVGDTKTEKVLKAYLDEAKNYLEISQLTSLDATLVMNLSNRLRKGGFVERITPAGERPVVMQITPAGRQRLDKQEIVIPPMDAQSTVQYAIRYTANSVFSLGSY